MLKKCYIADLRKAAGFTQVQLARIAGTTQNAISSLETGESFPSLRMAVNIAYALQCPVEALYEYSPEDLLP